jgi:hypothetical protein
VVRNSAGDNPGAARSSAGAAGHCSLRYSFVPGSKTWWSVVVARAEKMPRIGEPSALGEVVAVI